MQIRSIEGTVNGHEYRSISISASFMSSSIPSISWMVRAEEVADQASFSASEVRHQHAFEQIHLVLTFENVTLFSKRITADTHLLESKALAD